MIKELKEHEAIVIDLTGPQGNAFCLLGTAKNLAEKLGMDGDQICEEMMAGDYDNLVQVFDKHFGGFVTLYKQTEEDGE